MSHLPACSRALVTLIALLVLWGPVAPSQAEIPDQFSNLKVLPKDMGKRQLVDTMRSFSGALGVRCTHCHVQKVPGDFDSFDWAADDLEAKQEARVMLKMVGEINGRLLPQTEGGGSVSRVTCQTCHRGLTNPAPLDRVLTAVVAKDGADAAVRRYHELRDEYYGSGSYDFGPGTLAGVAGPLAQSGDLASAMTLLQLNLEIHPDDLESLMMVAQIHAQQGERDAAIEFLRKALEIEPDNPPAQRMLEQLQPEG